MSSPDFSKSTKNFKFQSSFVIIEKLHMSSVDTKRKRLRSMQWLIDINVQKCLLQITHLHCWYYNMKVNISLLFGQSNYKR